MGGLPKRASLLANLRQEAAPLLILDSGNLLFRAASYSADPLARDKDQATRIVRALKNMGLRVSGIGSLDLAAGIPFLEHLGAETGHTWLSANLLDQSGKTIFPPFVIQSIAGLQVAIAGLTALPGIRLDAAYHLADWQTVLPEVLGNISDKADMVILLSSYQASINQEIARRSEGIDILLQCGTPANRPPERVKNTLICTSEARGKYLALLEIDWLRNTVSWPVDQLTIKNLQRQHKALLARIRTKEQSSPPDLLAADAGYQSLLRQRELLESDMKFLTQQAESTQDSEVGHRNRFIPLTGGIPDDPAVSALLQEQIP